MASAFTALENLRRLIDHPVEMGHFSHAVSKPAAFRTKSSSPAARLRREPPAATSSASANGRSASSANRHRCRYVFLVTAVGNGCGGLEHRASTAALLAQRPALRRHDRTARATAPSSACAAMRYFHTWNVKRIKPAAFTPCDLERENYTTLLWAFEGFTSYYDDPGPLRSGAIELGTGWI